MAFTIVCPTDFSTSSDRALRHAVELAQGIEGAEIIVLHVDDLPTYGLPEGSVLDEPLRVAWRDRLEDLCERFSDRAHLIAATRRGRPAAEIIAHAERVGAHLIVMSTRARPALSAAILGSVTADVLHESPMPVLTVQPDARVDGVERVLVMTDLGASSEAALAMAVGFVEARGAHLHVLHSYRLPTYVLPDGAPIFAPQTEASVRDGAKARLDALVDAQNTSAPITTHLERGAPEESAVRIIRDEGIDIVVVGTHARVGLRRWILGSVAERMVRTCEVPVMVVRGTEESS